ncbi:MULTISPECIES: NADP-specific glutamate dehydrogenase [unclassified Halomonas]|uniref:NADP-specific glutamate dehydrogenase n=1 Tax=unclassified Halomonas TaxID=2609666 RepID=UPI002886BCA7|nr:MULTISPECIES: NADP-specific glutamate dehydrogenase [unclassified Halomonas]MDT0502745.1 NADP-specific glutamate dehydrogenase [Halomonas sp. PAR7]MDT0511101.1 NADP-specific glutamate dehydrogenase [Halomonas sp. LES1]MDT0593139.1 NADP-specific glutamate dehydrogenase [Halomonas sp. PAR8]
MPYVHETLENLRKSSPAQTEFYQAAEEVLECLRPLFKRSPHYHDHSIIERIVEPERQIMFRICWTDDEGRVQVNKGYRIQFNSALGPYKGGLRFHPSVTSGIIKFLGFEQIFKNALTGLPIGGGKGGSDFDPKGKSDGEIMRFCQAFMSELYRHIGPHTDVPAGDIGVGAREIGYLYGQYKRLTGRYEGVLTGKGLDWGGSIGRKEATGYGAVYFAQNMLEARGQTLEGKTCLVSGAGNVAIYTIEKLYELGAKPVTCTDSRGTLHDARGIDLDLLKQLKEVTRASLETYLEQHPEATYIPVGEYPEDGHAVWRIKADAAFPCATQNELTAADAEVLVSNGVNCISEGANMPSAADAVDRFLEAKIAYGPGKAANAGGVATSQLEMAQNNSMEQWPLEKVDVKLKEIMANIHRQCADTAEEFGEPTNLVLGANIAGFRKVADAMIDQGVV